MVSDTSILVEGFTTINEWFYESMSCSPILFSQNTEAGVQRVMFSQALSTVSITRQKSWNVGKNEGSVSISSRLKLEICFFLPTSNLLCKIVFKNYN